jgi:hypothetical protein
MIAAIAIVTATLAPIAAFFKCRTVLPWFRDDGRILKSNHVSVRGAQARPCGPRDSRGSRRCRSDARRRAQSARFAG